MGKLDGKVAVITGGAYGIGEATVRLFVEEGAKVVIADIEEDKGKRLAGELGDSAVFQNTNVAREQDVKAAVDFAVEKFGRLDCMFNNAGIGGAMGPIDQLSVEAFDMTMAVLLRGAFIGMKHAARVMKPRKSGSIINNASVAGLRTGFGPHTYSAAKAGIIQMTRTVAMELGEFGVRVNCICPGGIATGLFGKAAGLSAEDSEGIIEKIKAVFSDMQPIKRSGIPEDVARAALWLASDESSFVTGHPLVVDGGISGGRIWAQMAEKIRASLSM